MRTSPPVKDLLSSRVLRSHTMAWFMGAWLFFVPQVLNTNWSSNDDRVPPPMPLLEEEAKHSDALPLQMIGHVPDPSTAVAHPRPSPDAMPVRGDHGEVPHPPPWA